MRGTAATINHLPWQRASCESASVILMCFWRDGGDIVMTGCDCLRGEEGGAVLLSGFNLSWIRTHTHCHSPAGCRALLLLPHLCLGCAPLSTPLGQPDKEGDCYLVFYT